MSDAVLDASVVLKWFRSEGERNLDAARALRARFEAGELLVLAPPLLMLEILNVAALRWKLAERELADLAEGLGELGIELVEPRLEAVARRTARGMTAYDAAYVAVAEDAGLPLITDDEQVVAAAGDLARPLGARP